MVKVIMHGCNGKMGQVISGLIAADPDIELVAGIDARDDGHNPYPVFTDIENAMWQRIASLISLQPWQ